jgi:phosphoribosyl-dephospho-CoA transferase
LLFHWPHRRCFICPFGARRVPGRGKVRRMQEGCKRGFLFVSNWCKVLMAQDSHLVFHWPHRRCFICPFGARRVRGELRVGREAT